MKRHCDLGSWRVFCAVAQTGSISSACELVGMEASAVSRTIRSLEESLGGVPLIDRSMRPLKLTENGRTALRCAKAMLEAHQSLLESLNPDPLAMKGTIHVGLPPLVLQRFLLPFLLDFRKDYPDILLKISEYTGSAPVNFDTPHGRLDVICGYGADASHPNIVQIHYGNGVQIPCASTLYLEKFGTPQTPEDLAEHTGIIFESPMRPRVRYLEKGHQTAYLKFKDMIFFDSAGSAMTAALYGAGIHPGIPSLHAFQAIQRGELKVVLPGWFAPATKLYLYTRTEAARQKRVQIFIERYRAYMDALHRQCEKALEPFCGPLKLAAA